MIRTGFALGFGLAFGLAAIRNVPFFARPYPEAFFFLLLLALWICYRAGRYWRWREQEKVVAMAAAVAGSEARAEVRVQNEARAMAASVVNIEGPKWVTPEQVAAQWADDFDEEMESELAQHYAAEINRASGTRVSDAAARPDRRPSDSRPRPGERLWLPRGPEHPVT